jgi:hypothetical protein
VRKALIVAALIAALSPLSWPSVARASTIEMPAVQGRIIYDYHSVKNETNIRHLVVVNAEVGSSVVFGYTCRKCPIRSADRTLTVGPTGVVNLTVDGGFRFTRGDRWGVTIFDSKGRYRLAGYVARRERAPLLRRSCGQQDPTTKIATPIACEVNCETAQSYPEGDPCMDAGKSPGISTGGLSWHYTAGRTATRITRMRLTGVPEDATAIEICRGPDAKGRDCPFFVHALKPVSGVIELGRPIRRSRLVPGVQIVTWLVRGRERGTVVRLTMRRSRAPRVERLCMPQTSLEPVPC